MFKDLKNKTKSYILFIVFIAVLILSYPLSFKKTFSSIGEFNNQKKLEAKMHSNILELNVLKKQSDLLDYRTNCFIEGKSNLKSIVLDILIPYCSANSINIMSISSTHEFEFNHYLFETIWVKFSGTYSNILKLTHHTEQISKSGKIISVKYYSGFNRDTQKQEFYAELYFQNIKEKNK